MFDAMNIALSGMQAATRRMDVAASNIANMDSVGSLSNTIGSPGSGQPYQPLSVEQTSTAGGGVATTIRKVSPGSNASYDPQSPYANADGMVAAPNVDPLQEFSNMLTARTDFMANLAVFKVSSEMVKRLYEMTTDDKDDNPRALRPAWDVR